MTTLKMRTNMPSTTATTSHHDHPSSSSTTETMMNADDWAVISRMVGNGHCIECHAQFPEWGSIRFGILFCTRCCGGHRYVHFGYRIVCFIWFCLLCGLVFIFLYLFLHYLSYFILPISCTILVPWEHIYLACDPSRWMRGRATKFNA